ncbi:GNAT family N-acetyltransferase [Chitiniphilus purpureus]|uniref:GNAT family N-acetyltransferase n=1 Tax=Chitiniphilus purpureus TaxID=2981137 RepID=A0ABY6DW27_9NEIS|nr:GNAT family N-acetyltransferase [Chitiniphilus sp. CD1]UXY17256.1 GNAT family N-acetyltransferase [Chitiniphilus sp. CD1]
MQATPHCPQGLAAERQLAVLASPQPDLTDWFATPPLAAAWCDAIVDNWLAAEAAGGIDAAAPFTVLDLGPAGGRLRSLLLPRLRARLAALGRGHWRVDYRNDDAVAAPGANPVALLALGALGAPVPALFGVHYGRTLRGELLATPDCESGELALRCEWYPVSAAALAALPGSYARHLSSAAFTMPLAALARLDALTQAAQGRYLLLAADCGVLEAREIRLGALHPPERFTVGIDRLPLNLHALGCHLRAQQAQWRALQQQASGVALLLAWCDPARPAGNELADALLERLGSAFPSDQAVLLEAAGQLPPRLGLLRRSGHDPAVCVRMLPALIEALPAWDEVERAAWRAALHRVAAVLADPAPPELLIELAGVATQLDDLGLARQLLRRLLSQVPGHVPARRELARLEAGAGRPALAIELLQALVAEVPADGPAQALLAHLQARAAAHGAFHWYRPAACRDGELTLEPLGPEHAAALFHQYRDPQIGMMTRLPEFDDAEAMARWLAESAGQPARRGYAVVHADAGAIGVVSIHCHADAGYLHFWLGTDWQGRGLAGRMLACALRAQAGELQLYTSVYRDNARSRRVLQTAGFVKLACAAEPPDDDLLFLNLGGTGDRAGLARLLAGLASPITLAAAQPTEDTP